VGTSSVELEQPRTDAEAGPRLLRPVADGDVSVREISYGAAKSLGRELFETILITLMIFLLAQSMVQNRRVDGHSMDPTLQDQEYLLIDKFSYLRWDNTLLANLLHPETDESSPLYILGRGPQRGDIVVLHPPEDERDYIKRIVALPGETIEVKHDDGVYINGVRLYEPYIKEAPTYDYPAYTVPANHVFVLGDNRNNSNDSHAWKDPALKIDEIVGKAWISYWPQALWGPIPHPTYAGLDTTDEP
jgi:signal peptidase I